MMKNELFYIQYPYRPELDHPDNVCEIKTITFGLKMELTNYDMQLNEKKICRALDNAITNLRSEFEDNRATGIREIV